MAVASSQGSVQAATQGMPKLAGRPESAQVVPVAQPSSLRTPRSVHSRTSVHHERVPYVPPSFGLYNSMPRSFIVSINLVTRNFDNCPVQSDMQWTRYISTLPLSLTTPTT